MIALVRRAPLARDFGRLCLRCFSASVKDLELEAEKNSCSNGARMSRGFIHPSAVVHPDAVLGQDVTIGPFCTVGPLVKVGNFCRLHPGSHISGDTRLGDNCILMTGAIVGEDIPGRTVIGHDNIIGYHCVLGAKCQDMKHKPGSECFLDIGNNNDIREYTSIHRSSVPDKRTIIGNSNLIMGSCHIAHDCKVGNNNILANGTLLAGHCVMEDYVRTAGSTVVHQFCQIGSFSFVGGGSVVSQDVPRYTMVSGERAEIRGLNLEGLRRRGFSDKEIRALRAAYRRIFMPRDGNSPSIEERLKELENDEELGREAVVCSMVRSVQDSFAGDRRGICKNRSWNQDLTEKCYNTCCTHLTP